MDFKRSSIIIIAALSSIAGLTSLANASLVPTTSVVPATTAPKTVATVKPAVVTAATPQFSYSGSAPSQVNLTTTLGNMLNQATTANLNLGGGIIKPAAAPHILFPTAASATPDATPLQHDANYLASMQETSTVNSTFMGPDGEDGMMDTDGNIDRQKFGQWMVGQGIISDDYAGLYYSDDAAGTTILKTKSSSAIFSSTGDDS